MKTIGYVRVSTKKQELDRQIEDITKYCDYKGYDLIDIKEEKMSGLKKVRPVLTEVIEFIKSNQIDFLIISELSRLGRTIEVINTIEILSDLKCGVISLKENLYTLNEDKSKNPTSELIINVLSGLNKFELDTFNYRNKSGFLSKIQSKPIWKGKYIPYGYSKDVNKELIINPIESQVVKDIFQLYIDGNTTWKIQNILNEKNIKTKNGTYWRKEKIQSMLTNSLYMGLRKFTIDKDTDNNKIYDYFPFPSIVSEETFNKVQKIIEQKIHKQSNHKKYTYLFDQKKIICGICGKTYFPFYKPSQDNKNKKEERYICNSKKLPGMSCENYGISISKLDRTILYIISKHFWTNFISSSNSTMEIDNKIIKLEDYIKTLNSNYDIEINKENNLVSYSIDTNMSVIVFKKQLESIKNNQETILKEIDRINNEIEDLNIQKKSLKNLDRFKNLVKEKKYNRDDIRSIVDKIIIYPDKFNVLSDNKRDKSVRIHLYIGGEITELSISQYSNRMLLNDRYYTWNIEKERYIVESNIKS